MNFQSVNTGAGLSQHDHMTIPIRANTEHYTLSMSPSNSYVLPQTESLVQRAFHIYSEVEKQIQNENPRTFLHLFYNSNNRSSQTINLGESESTVLSNTELISLPSNYQHNDLLQKKQTTQPTYNSELIAIIKSSILQHQDVEGQLRELLNQFNKSTGDLNYIIERLLDKQFALKNAPIDLLSELDAPTHPTTGYEDPIIKPIWVTPFLPISTTSQQQSLPHQNAHYSAFTTSATQVNEELQRVHTIRDIISPDPSTLTEKQYKLAMVRIIIIKRKIQLIKSNQSLRFFLKSHKERLLQSTQLFHDLSHISTYFPITLPTYKTQHTNHNNITRQSNPQQPKHQSSPSITTNNYSLPLSNTIINGLHTQHASYFLSNNFFAGSNPFYSLFDPQIHHTEYQFVSHILTDSIKAKALNNSLFFTKNIFMHNIAIFAQNFTHDQQYSTTPQQIMSSFYKQQIAHHYNNLTNVSHTLSSPSTTRSLIVQFDSQFASNASYKQSPSPIFHPQQYTKKSQLARGDYGIIYSQNFSLTESRQMLKESLGIADTDKDIPQKLSSSRSEMTNEGGQLLLGQNDTPPQDIDTLLTKYDSLTQTMDDIKDTQHWQRILGGLQRQHQQTITQSLLHRLILEESLYSTGNVTNLSSQSGPTTVDYALSIDKEKMLTKSIQDKIKKVQNDYEIERRILQEQLALIQTQRGKFDEELFALTQHQQQQNLQTTQSHQSQPQQQLSVLQSHNTKESTLAHDEKILQDKLVQLQTIYERESTQLQAKLKELSQLQISPPALGSTYNTQWTLLPDVLLKNELDQIEIIFKSHTINPENPHSSSNTSLISNPITTSPNISQSYNPFQSSIFPSPSPSIGLNSIPTPHIDEYTENTNIHQGFKISVTGQLTFLEEQTEQFTRSIQLSDLLTQTQTQTPSFHQQIASRHYLFNEISRIFLLLHYLYFLQYSQTVTIMNSLPLLHKLNIPFYSQFYLRTPNMVQLRLDDGYGDSPSHILPLGVQKDPLTGLQLKEQELLYDSLSAQYLLYQQTLQQTEQSYYGTMLSNTSRQYNAHALSNASNVTTVQPSFRHLASSTSLATNSSTSSNSSNSILFTNSNCHFFSSSNQSKHAQHTLSSMDSHSSPNTLHLQSFPHSFLHIFITHIKNISNKQIIHNKLQIMRSKITIPWNSAQHHQSFTSFVAPSLPSQSSSPSSLQYTYAINTKSSKNSLDALNTIPNLQHNFSSRKLQPQRQVNFQYNKSQSQQTSNISTGPASQTPIIKPKIFITFSESSPHHSSSLTTFNSTPPSSISTPFSPQSHFFYSKNLNVILALPSGQTSTITLCRVMLAGGLITLTTYQSVLTIQPKLHKLVQSLSNNTPNSPKITKEDDNINDLFTLSLHDQQILNETIVSSPLELITVLHDSIRQIMMMVKRL